uniref:Uncharacterized protein n=1 Tax=Rhizophora mucronata TaxID=61149 RepID=A0A2P2NRB5_RHIMU
MPFSHFKVSCFSSLIPRSCPILTLREMRKSGNIMVACSIVAYLESLNFLSYLTPEVASLLGGRLHADLPFMSHSFV